jgi:hypothetical protein
VNLRTLDYFHYIDTFFFYCTARLVVTIHDFLYSHAILVEHGRYASL